MLQTTPLTLTPPPPFDFTAAASSHGWVALLPNAWQSDPPSMSRVQRLASGQVVLLEITGESASRQPSLAIQVQHPEALAAADKDEILTFTGHMFRLDEDLEPFYRLCLEKGSPWERLSAGLGRLLRSPTVFEDVVKTICTTNVQWGGTLGMVRRLVNTYGEPFAGDLARRAFPTPQALAVVPFEIFAAQARLGYRASYIHSLAQQAASGELDLEGLAASPLPTSELRKRLLALKGVGPYAAATLLMLLGRYDEIGVDTVFRTFVSRKYFAGQAPKDSEALAVYQDWGQWKYLAYWFDLWTDYTGQ